MDGASLPIAIFILLIGAGFWLANVAAVGVGGEATGRYGEIPQPIDGEPVSLGRYDKVAAYGLRSTGVIFLIAALLILLGIVVPAAGYEWLTRPMVTLTAIAFISGGNQLHFAPEEGLGDRELRRLRLGALAWTALAVLSLYFVIKF